MILRIFSAVPRWLSAALHVLFGFDACCRFLPSCSEYSRDALIEHGAVKGTWLTLHRLARCHPWGDEGYDPVPARKGVSDGQ